MDLFIYLNLDFVLWVFNLFLFVVVVVVFANSEH